MAKYQFLKADHEALATRCEALRAQARLTVGQTADAARSDSAASQDGTAARQIQEDAAVAARQLAEMSEWLANSEVVTPPPFDGRVKLNSIVTVRDVSNDQRHTYRISGFWSAKDGLGTEADPANISYMSPLAKALMGKARSGSAELNIGGRATNYFIIDVM